MAKTVEDDVNENTKETKAEKASKKKIGKKSDRMESDDEKAETAKEDSPKGKKLKKNTPKKEDDDGSSSSKKQENTEDSGSDSKQTKIKETAKKKKLPDNNLESSSNSERCHIRLLECGCLLVAIWSLIIHGALFGVAIFGAYFTHDKLEPLKIFLLGVLGYRRIQGHHGHHMETRDDFSIPIPVTRLFNDILSLYIIIIEVCLIQLALSVCLIVGAIIHSANLVFLDVLGSALSMTSALTIAIYEIAFFSMKFSYSWLIPLSSFNFFIIAVCSLVCMKLKLSFRRCLISQRNRS